MLTPTQQQMLDLAGKQFKYAGSIDVLARERFDLSPTRFWQEVNRLIVTEAAVAYRPDLVARLAARRTRAQRPRLASRILD